MEQEEELLQLKAFRTAVVLQGESTRRAAPPPPPVMPQQHERTSAAVTATRALGQELARAPLGAAPVSATSFQFDRRESMSPRPVVAHTAAVARILTARNAHQDSSDEEDHESRHDSGQRNPQPKGFTTPDASPVVVRRSYGQPPIQGSVARAAWQAAAQVARSPASPQTGHTRASPPSSPSRPFTTARQALATAGADRDKGTAKPAGAAVHAKLQALSAAYKQMTRGRQA